MSTLTTHLNFYIKNKISPVHYVTENIQEHFERRASLYRSLGMLPLAFRASRVLEVAVGSGQNSLYISSLFPKSLTLVEPNPTGISEIRELYNTTQIKHTPPELIASTLQEYVPAHEFDIVICENWLGRSPGERVLLKKLAGMLAHDGMMVVTTQPPSGLLANVIRRALTVKYCDPLLTFEERTEKGVVMFEPHLANLNAMTRSAKDWVQDNMLNPAYFDLYLTLPDVLQEVGTSVTAVGTNPRFSVDWRWFKSLYGNARNFNGHLVSQYESILHNLFDYELEFNQPNVKLNQEIEMLCVDFIESVRTYELAASTGVGKDSGLSNSTALLARILAKMEKFPERLRNGLNAGLQLLLAQHSDYAEVAKPSAFSRLFGKENIYVSLIADGYSR